MKILLAGGGSGGPVTPVIAVALEIKKNHPKAEFLFVGTKHGPEKAMVTAVGIKFVAIPAARWRRYFTVRNLFSPFILLAGFLKARKIVKKFKPDVVFSAGGYVAVPVSWASKLNKVKVVIHQQDASIGLANKLIAPFADQITTSFEETSKEFYSGSGLGNKTWKIASWVGNPVRSDLFNSKADVKKAFHLHDELPVLLVLGGATGAMQINSLIEQILPDLVTAHQVIHQTGTGKNKIKYKHRNYHPRELISFDQYAAILKMAHLVIARAGLSTIGELSALAKAAVIIPMPHTHQEENAKILQLTHSAVVLMRNDANAENLKQVINNLKFNQKRTDVMAKNISNLIPKDAAANLAKIILTHVKA